MPILKNSRHESFCQNVVAGMSATQAYIKAGYTNEQLAATASAARLLTNDNVSQRIQEIRASISKRLEQRVIRSVNARVDELTDAFNRLKNVVLARAADPEMQAVPGGDQGVLVRQFKAVGKSVVEEFKADTALFAEMRSCLEQTAKELGQWSLRQDVTVRTSLSDLPDSEIVALIAEAEGRREDLHGSEVVN